MPKKPEDQNPEGKPADKKEAVAPPDPKEKTDFMGMLQALQGNAIRTRPRPDDHPDGHPHVEESER